MCAYYILLFAHVPVSARLQTLYLSHPGSFPRRSTGRSGLSPGCGCAVTRFSSACSRRLGRRRQAAALPGARGVLARARRRLSVRLSLRPCPRLISVKLAFPTRVPFLSPHCRIVLSRKRQKTQLFRNALLALTIWLKSLLSSPPPPRPTMPLQ